MEKIYRQQVSLLLSVLPEVAKEKCFALHGGTAINLFVRDMPLLSVDIDLTYIPIEDRDTSLKNSADALQRIKSNIEKVIPGVKIAPRLEAGKLQISAKGVDVKIEASLVNRGALEELKDMELCQKAQTTFEAFCVMPVISHGQLFGGKIVAALDRKLCRISSNYLLVSLIFAELLVAIRQLQEQVYKSSEKVWVINRLYQPRSMQG